MKRKLEIFLITAIILLGTTLRTFSLHNPLGDWHSWRQADTASVAREYVKAGQIDLFHPKFHDLSSIPSGLDNPDGYRMVEFPLRDGLHAYLFMHFPTVGFVEWGRILSIIFSAFSILFIYLITKKLSGRRAGTFAALIYAIIPYNIYYGRVILPEPMLVMFTLISLYAYFLYLDKGKYLWLLLSGLSLTLAILLKPTALVILLPAFGYYLANLKNSFFKIIPSFLLVIISVIPYILWRKYIAAYPSGIPASSWLFNSNHIRFKGAWFRWLFGERIAKLILGYWGLIPLGFGIAKLGLHKKETLVYGGMLIGSLVYLSIIATGNVQHDYYQIQIMPTISILVGVGFAYLASLASSWRKLIIYPLILFVLGLSLALSWYEVRGYFWVNNQAMVKAGQMINQITPPDALVIAPYMGDTAFLFQTDRRGWPIGGDIENKIKQGATYYVTTTRDDEFNALKSKYQLIEENDDFAIIKLTPKL